MITVRFFASLREAVGMSDLEFQLQNESCVEDLLVTLSQQGENWTALLESDVLVAVNQTLSSKSASIKDSDEVAFFPPVTGG
ncbi:molybdopterin converting factor subunit 1 [Glaciecola sp. 2405UD65-10]|uniref:molybdopterin converting factor subunit 1 n=1 Tax=Glaciecola sp. 2405UD65-10 TaxID=3397244 RepID=UPI003B5C0FCF